MKLPLRVAMIIRPYHPPVGGAERQLAALIPLLKLHNIEVNVVTRRYPGQNAFDLVEGVPVYRIRVLVQSQLRHYSSQSQHYLF